MRVRNEWVAWLRDHCPGCTILSEAEDEHHRKKFAGDEHAWGKGLSYEVSGVSQEEGVSVVLDSLRALGIDEIVAWVGDSAFPLVASFDVESFARLLERTAVNEDTVSISAVGFDGRAQLSIPADQNTDELFVSGTGQLERLAREVKLRAPGGVVFRGN